ncbi:unnamed protein product [Lactuca saligna]|uniref:No apical meristem-associated C-terminal domain-containing protein n=1 Tax=Lactuca saligna TaxID=75948 RepID=A0AA36E5M6_LACSI|nr:unnamed protein product [Lactuca saligna]
MLKRFKFTHVWEAVKRSIRWKELATHEDIANPPKRKICPPPRPVGRDKAKARGKGKATSSNSSVGMERSTRSEEMMAQLNTTLEKHMTETVRLVEFLLLIQDVRHLDPEDQEVAKILKTSIREKYKLKRN